MLDEAAVSLPPAIDEPHDEDDDDDDDVHFILRRTKQTFVLPKMESKVTSESDGCSITKNLLMCVPRNLFPFPRIRIKPRQRTGEKEIKKKKERIETIR